ncbi:NusG domain II-containing protein [Cetobacterium sp. SF1]|uniref:NusG domain II-containing protein n=1 Tax=unclassified Cetobacterium TaxID=2630983 RepID=UPI003CF4D5B3
MKQGRRRTYFKKYDIIIYLFLFLFFASLGKMIQSFKYQKASKAEIYVDGDLKYVYPLQNDEKNIFVNTEIGGVNVKFQDNMVRVTSSNSPLKLCVKQGWIKNPGDVIVGVPDKLLIKIIGDNSNNDSEEQLDFILR